jgi:hypothetical protein
LIFGQSLHFLAPYAARYRAGQPMGRGRPALPRPLDAELFQDPADLMRRQPGEVPSGT